MGRKSLVQRSVDKAFQLAGDLGVIAIFTKKSQSTFDFNTQSVVPGAETSLAARGIFSKKVKKSKDSGGVLTGTLLIKADGFETLDLADLVTINNERWKITHPILNDGFILTLELIKWENT